MEDKQKDQIIKWSSVVCADAVIILLIIFLQLLLYSTAPKLSYDKPFKCNFDKQAACNQLAFHHNKTLILELLIGGILLTLTNYLLLKGKVQKPVLTLCILILIYLLITGLSLAYFTMEFVNLNMRA